MKKFTKLWQLMMILLLSSSIVFAQEKKVTTSQFKMDEVEKTSSEMKIPELQKKQLMEKGLASEKEIKQGELSDKALEFINAESKAFQEKSVKKNANINSNDLKPLPGSPNPSEAFNWLAYAVSGEETNLNWPTPERATFFEIYDFCLEGPVTIEQVSHLFYEHPSYIWPDSTFHFKIYDADGVTLLHESVDLEAENYVEYFYTLPTPLVVTDDFWVAVVPVDVSGHPSSMSTSAHDGYSYNGSAGSWTFYPGFEYITGAYAEGTDAGPRLSATPDPFDFGAVTLGGSQTQIFTIENYCPAGGSLTLDPAPDLTGDAAFTIISDNGAPYPTILPTDQTTVEIEVQFSPTLLQSYSTVLNIYDNLTENTTSINITGNGLPSYDCDWYLVGVDSYNDGWNGGYVEVWQDGILTFTYIGPPDLGGPYGVPSDPDTAYFGILEGASMDLVWSSGAYDGEITYELFNNFEVLVFDDGPSPIGTTGIAATCLPPSCFDPINLETTAITETGARAGWDPGFDETAWNFEWGPAGFTLGSGTLVPVTSSGYIFPTLSPATYYDWYVQSDCGSSQSGWVGPITFRTDLPNAGIPLLEDFEVPADGFNITQNHPDNGADWVVVDTMSYGGISSAYNVHDVDQVNIMELTVQVDLTAKINAQLSFWHIAKTEGDWDHCFVEISTDGGITYAPIPAGYYVGTGDYSVPDFNNDPPNDGPCFDEESYPEWGTSNTTLVDTMWMQEKFNLTPYNTFTEVTFRFRLTSDVSVNRAGWMIDDIEIIEYTCPPVYDITLDEVYPTTATIGWTSVSGSSNVEWDTAGYTQGTTLNTLTGVSSPQTLSPLIANTTYDVYIQDDCGSDWMFYQFTTGCVECPVGSTPEGEICSDSTNNGCNLVAPLFGSVSSGETICGNTWDDGSTRDTDWYEFTTTDAYTRVTIIAESDINLVVGNIEQTIPGDPGCANNTGFFAPSMIVPPCDIDTLIFDLDAPGTYYLFVGQQSYVGNVCPGARYWFSLNLQAISAPAATIDPTSFDVAVPENGSANRDLTIGNTGEYQLDYSAQITNYGLGAKGTSKDVLLTEDFESGTFPPTGWSVVNNGGTCDWDLNSVIASISNLTPGTGDCAEANSDACGSGGSVNTYMLSPAFDLSGYTFASVTFATYYNDIGAAGDFATFDVTIDGGTTWTNLFTWDEDHSETTLVSLDAYAGQASVILRWHYQDDGWDWYWQVDDVVVEGLNAPTGWLTLDGSPSVAGTIFEGDPDDDIAVGFDAAGLAIGVYTADIELTTNEPAADAVYTIPVSFTVAQSYTVSGILSYSNGASTAMDLVDVSLMEGATEVGATTTDEFGAFSFSTIDGSYEYMASTTKPWGGITTIDGVLAARFAVGLFPLNALQQLAGDVNGAGGVTTIDGILIKRRAVGLLPSWPAPDYVFENPPVDVIGANVVVDFQTLCSGDVNRSFIPPNFCPPPTDLAVSNLTLTSGDATWTSPAGLSNLEYGPTGFTPGAGTTLTGVTSPTTISGAPGDVIDVYVQDDCGGLSQSDWVGPETFTLDYCDASNTGSQDEYIGNVTCGSINNSTAWQSGVADYTAITTSIAAGSSEAIAVTNSGGAYGTSDYVTVWVDWGTDLVFDLGGDEEFILVNDGTGVNFSGSILVPVGTPAGTYRMRVRLAYGSSPAPCGTTTWGEIEDYSIVVP